MQKEYDAMTTDTTLSPGRRYFRSKSAASNDPQSPYYTSPRVVAGGRVRSPSVACVPYYDAECRLTHQNRLAVDEAKTSTIRQHYYPEGGWGWVVCGCAVVAQILCTGLHSSYGLLLLEIIKKFNEDGGSFIQAVCIGSLSTTVALFLSPIAVALCRKKSARVMAIFGGIVAALGCLFTSFVTQFHQLYLSYGIVIGCGVTLVRTTATAVICEYFKRKREFVEIFLCAATGFGTAIMPIVLVQSINTLGWRFGFQVIASLLALTIVVSLFFRPASLYHPQRRAILHIKCLQKRSKSKEKSLSKSKVPYFDFKVLKSRTVQILLCGSSLTAFGVSSPNFLLIYESNKEIDRHSLLLLQVFLGIACALGTCLFGLIVVRNSVQCLIAKQYLCQAAIFLISGSLLALTVLREYQGYIMFVWTYGIFYGGYQYSLKVFTLEKVRARNFMRAWSFVEWSQAIPNMIGVPVAGYLNDRYGNKTGFYFSSFFALLGSLTMFGIDVHRRRTRKKKQDDAKRKISELSTARQNAEVYRRQELTCISEEAIADNFDDFLDDCITSCNKEEKFLMLSEFENNLSKTQEVMMIPKKPLRKLAVVTPPCFEQCPNCNNWTTESIKHKTFCKDSVTPEMTGLL